MGYSDCRRIFECTVAGVLGRPMAQWTCFPFPNVQHVTSGVMLLECSACDSWCDTMEVTLVTKCSNWAVYCGACSDCAGECVDLNNSQDEGEGVNDESRAEYIFCKCV